MNTIITLTGVPATGKTTIMRELKRDFSDKGMTVATIVDYPLMQEWLQTPASTSYWEASEETFNLFPEAYGVMSPYIARRIGEESKFLFEDEVDVVLVEAARGAGEPRDTYISGFFMPLIEGLQSNKRVNLINVEVAANTQELRDRINLRYTQDPDSPPPFVLEKYLLRDQPARSSVAELGAASHVLETGCVAITGNVRIRNEGDIMRTKERLSKRLVDSIRYGYPMTTEGVLKGKER